MVVVTSLEEASKVTEKLIELSLVNVFLVRLKGDQTTNKSEKASRFCSSISERLASFFILMTTYCSQPSGNTGQQKG